MTVGLSGYNAGGGGGSGMTLVSAVLARKLANQSVPDGGATTIEFDGESYDDDGWHNPSSLSGRLTVPAVANGAIVTVSAALIMNGGSGSGAFTVLLNRYDSGGTLLEQVVPSLSAASNNGYQGYGYSADFGPVATGDYFETQVGPSSTGVTHTALGDTSGGFVGGCRFSARAYK